MQKRRWEVWRRFLWRTPTLRSFFTDVDDTSVNTAQSTIRAWKGPWSVQIEECCDRMQKLQRADLVWTFYQSGNSASAGLKRYMIENNLKHDLCSVSPVSRQVDKLETFGRICDRSTFSQQEIQAVESEMKDRQSLSSLCVASCRNVAKGLETPLSSVHKILRLHLQLKPYRIKHLRGDLTESWEFAPRFLDACANDEGSLPSPPRQATVRNCAFFRFSQGLTLERFPRQGPVFFRPNQKFWKYLELCRSVTLQQDGAPLHIANSETFSNRNFRW